MTASAVQTAGQGKAWYVVVTHVHQEKHARYQLEQQGFTVYLPRSRLRPGPGPAMASRPARAR